MLQAVNKSNSNPPVIIAGGTVLTDGHSAPSVALLQLMWHLAGHQGGSIYSKAVKLTVLFYGSESWTI